MLPGLSVGGDGHVDAVRVLRVVHSLVKVVIAVLGGEKLGLSGPGQGVSLGGLLGTIVEANTDLEVGEGGIISGILVEGDNGTEDGVSLGKSIVQTNSVFANLGVLVNTNNLEVLLDVSSEVLLTID